MNQCWVTSGFRPGSWQISLWISDSCKRWAFFHRLTFPSSDTAYAISSQPRYILSGKKGPAGLMRSPLPWGLGFVWGNQPGEGQASIHIAGSLFPAGLHPNRVRSTVYSLVAQLCGALIASAWSRDTVKLLWVESSIDKELPARRYRCAELLRWLPPAPTMPCS